MSDSQFGDSQEFEDEVLHREKMIPDWPFAQTGIKGRQGKLDKTGIFLFFGSKNLYFLIVIF